MAQLQLQQQITAIQQLNYSNPQVYGNAYDQMIQQMQLRLFQLQNSPECKHQNPINYFNSNFKAFTNFQISYKIWSFASATKIKISQICFCMWQETYACLYETQIKFRHLKSGKKCYFIVWPLQWRRQVAKLNFCFIQTPLNFILYHM